MSKQGCRNRKGQFARCGGLSALAEIRREIALPRKGDAPIPITSPSGETVAYLSKSVSGRDWKLVAGRPPHQQVRWGNTEEIRQDIAYIHEWGTMPLRLRGGWATRRPKRAG